VRLENIMSTVIVDVSNDYVDELMYSYQLVKDDDGTFHIWVETSVLRGYYAGKGIEDFSEAFQTLYDVIDEHEGVLA
jgi:hypothetical protein